MNRPEVRNAQNARMIDEMDEAFKDAEHDSKVRIVMKYLNNLFQVLEGIQQKWGPSVWCYPMLN